nr:MAG TPA: hypothetical protein [Caudoviricetes sp.]DAW46224.1 MAG TPA: hypothetical protein [Bacteriophage sp.]
MKNIKHIQQWNQISYFSNQKHIKLEGFLLLIVPHKLDLQRLS